MAANFLSVQMNEYLAKLQKPSKPDRYLRKLSQMGVTVNLLTQTNAIEIVKSFASHPQHGQLARKIIEEWKQEVSPTSSPSSIASYSDESCDSIDVFPSGKRRISHYNAPAKRAKVEVESNNWEFKDEKDKKQFMSFSDRVDEAIRRNLLPDPSHPSYAGALADFTYGEEEKTPISIPKKNQPKPNVRAPKKNLTKVVKKPTPLMAKSMKMARAGRK